MASQGIPTTHTKRSTENQKGINALISKSRKAWTLYKIYGQNPSYVIIALLWQKEASDIPSKSELFKMFSYSTQAKFDASTLILLRDMLGKTSWYSIVVSRNYILLLYEKFHFCHLLPFAKVGQDKVWPIWTHDWNMADIAHTFMHDVSPFSVISE